MPRTTITVDGWKCCRCEYTWKDKAGKKPLRCPSCGSPYWDIPRKCEEEKKNETKTN